MSSSYALGIVPGRRPVDLAEYRNSHGWAPSIWPRLLKNLYGYEGSPLSGGGEKFLYRLWQEIEEQPEWVQAANVLTFDTGVIPGQAYLWAADMLDEFERQCPANPNHVNHVPAVAALLRSLPEVPMFGMHGTSVSENPFDPWDEDQDAPGSGIPLHEMYLLGRHWSFVPGYEDALKTQAEMARTQGDRRDR